MLRDSQGKRLWIMAELGGHAPVRSFADITDRQRGRGRSDWRVVAKSPDWMPPGQPEGPKSLLSLGVDAGAGGGHTMIGAGHKPQGYDERGRYTGPRGGAADMATGKVRLYAEGAGEEPDADEPEAEAGEAQNSEEVYRELEGVLVADSGRVVTDAGGLSGGYEVRGPVTPPPAGNGPPVPPAPKEPHLTYSQHWGELRDSEDKTLGVGYSGKGEARDNGELEGQKDKGPIPRGNYKVAEIVDDPNDPRNQKMGPHILRLEPADQQTRDRLAAMNRDGFYIHGGGADASTGCIIMGRTVREGIPQGTIIHVQR